MAKTGALARDPKAPSFKYAENKAAYGGLNPQQQQRYQRILQNKGRGAANAFLGKTSGQTVRQPGQGGQVSTQPVGATPFGELSPEQQMNQMGDVSGGVFNQMGGYAQQFNPQTFQQQYEPQFQQAMDKARQSVMGQFEQRTGQAFAKERQDFETAMANRGVAPGSQQYQVELQGLTDRQDRSRQEAMNAAEQAAQGIQAQGYQQATGAAMLPGEIAGQFLPPSMAQYQQAANMQTMTQQQQFNKELAALENKYRLQQIKATPRGGGGGGGGLDPYQQYELAETMGRYNEQAPQPNPWSQAAASFAGSFGAGLASRYGK